MFPEKATSGFPPKCFEGLEKRLAMPARNAGDEGPFGFLQGGQPSRLTGAPLGRELRPHRPPIVGVVGADHQLLGREPIDELGDVRAHASAALGQGAQGEGLAGGHQLGQDVHLGQRQPERLERGLQTVLDRMQGIEDLNGQERKRRRFLHDCNIQHRRKKRKGALTLAPLIDYFRPATP